MSKQATLFQSWGQKAKPSTSTSSGEAGASGGLTDLNNEEDDEELLLAIAESLKDVPGAAQPLPSASNRPKLPRQLSVQKNSNVLNTKGKQATLFKSFGNDAEKASEVMEPVAGPSIEDDIPVLPDISNIPDLPGFDKEAGHMWIYPTNYTVREYQYNIIKEALFENTLVVLPTGLGKTFIAAVIMYNFYRWYPEGKVIFMAPTKPLVAQQIEACYNIMGIPQSDAAEMMGAMQPSAREKSWLQQRVFFLTPQVMVNDLSRGVCPYNDVRCLVVDEAHKALGNHAYCQVVRELVKYNQNFRILCLSATPGSDIKAVQQVISNMLVSHVELRTEDMPDLLPYVHERKVDKVVVPLGEELSHVKDKYLGIIGTVVNRLKRHGVIYNREPKSLSKFLILKAREAFRQDPPANLQGHQKGAIEGDFAMCMSLYHGYELLQQHGLRSLFSFLDSVLSGDKSNGRTRNELQRNADFCNLMEQLRNKFEPARALLPHTQATQRASQAAKPLATGHPKLNKLEEIVLQHFRDFQDKLDEESRDGHLNTRVMIFAQYRDSVSEITEILNRHRPLVRVMSFIGQSSVGKSARGFTQKEQLKVMKQFREGGYNTLVSTCVGEEGLDIGDVDLIVCFDAHKSPIRLVQRMGRTGRKREGRIVMLVTEGKEEQIYNQSQYSKRSIHKAILNGTKSLLYYPQNPRMVPDGLTPICHKMHITIHSAYQAAGSKQSNRKTADMPSNKPSRGKNVQKKCDGYLTNEELAYWSDKFKETEPLPSLPQSQFLSLPKRRGNEGLPDLEPFDPDANFLKLNEWMPWQNRLQQTHRVSHSLQSQHLVDLIEFMDIQNAVGDDDNYGQEMMLYLNDEDILKAGQTNKPGILRFCTPHAKQSRKRGINKKRRSEKLPGFDSDLERDSEDELPNLNDMMQRAASAAGAEVTSNGDTDDTLKELTDTPKLAKAGVTRKMVTKTLRSKTQTKRFLKTPTGKKISLNHMASPSQRKKVKKTCRNVSFSDIGDNSMIPVIADVDDAADFENITQSVVDSAAIADVEALQTVIEDSEKCIPSPENPPQDLHTDDPSSVMETEKDEQLEKLFPDFISQAKTSQKNRSQLSENARYRIPPAPSLDLIDSFMTQLDAKGRLSPVDVLALVQQWEGKSPESTVDTAEEPLVLPKADSPQKKLSNDAEIMNDIVPLQQRFNISITTAKDEMNVGTPKFSSSLAAQFTGMNYHEFDDTMEVETFETYKTADAGSQNITGIPTFKTPVRKSQDKITGSPLVSATKFRPPTVASTPVARILHHKASALDTAGEHQSFFGDEDDDILAAVQTPPNQSKLDQSVFTFSQALLAVHSSVESPSSESASSHEKSPVVNSCSKALADTNCKYSPQKTENTTAKIFSPEKSYPIAVLPPADHSASVISPVASTMALKITSPAVSANITLPGNNTDTETPVCNVSKKGSSLESPHFDLGFDLDELDESMVIPPSPPRISQSVLCQNSLKTRPSLIGGLLKARKSLNSANSANSNMQQSPRAIATEPTTSLGNAVVEQFDDINFDDTFETGQNSGKISTEISNDEDASPLFTSIKAIGQDNLQVPVARVGPTRISVTAQTETAAPISQLLHTTNVALVSVTEVPETECFEQDASFKEEAVNISAAEQDDGEDTDESIIGAPRKRRAVIMSRPSPVVGTHTDEESPFKSPIGRAKRVSSKKAVKFVISSEEEDGTSEELSIVLGEEDDDFQDEIKTKPAASKKPDSKKKREHLKSSKKKSGGREFLDTEAVLSEDEWSSDEMEGSQMDWMEASFINDASQFTQHTEVDMHAVYMKSVKSPARGGRFKLRYDIQPHMDVFSQPHRDEYSEYLEDSFCVDNEYESCIDDNLEEEEESGPGELTMLEEALKSKKRKAREKDKKSSKATGKRKRIVMQDSSSSEDEPKIKEPAHTGIKKPKTNRVISDSSDEVDEVSKSTSSDAFASKTSANFVTKKVVDVGMSELSKSKNKLQRCKKVSPETAISQKMTSSLASRCQLRLAANKPDDKAAGTPEIPVFALGLLDDELVEPTDCDINTTAVTTSVKANCKSTKTSISRGGTSDRTGLVQSASSKNQQSETAVSAMAGSTALNNKKSPDMLRAERLRLSKLKQQEFRQKMQQKQQLQHEADSSAFISSQSFSPVSNESFTIPQASASFKKPHQKIAVLVDSKEINGAQLILSELRSKHDVIVEVRQLGSCDYILSNRMAVERKVLTDFTNGSNKARLLERVQQMCHEFERPCIIIEKDRLKPGEEKKNIPLLKTKYVECMLAYLAQTNIKVFFTDTQEETSALLAELAQQEERKGFAVTAKLHLTPSQQQILSFYLSLPRVSYVTGLNLLHNFRTINEFIHSIPGIIARRGHMPANRAKDLHQYLKRKFNEQLIGVKR